MSKKLSRPAGPQTTEHISQPCTQQALALPGAALSCTMSTQPMVAARNTTSSALIWQCGGGSHEEANAKDSTAVADAAPDAATCWGAPGASKRARAAPATWPANVALANAEVSGVFGTAAPSSCLQARPTEHGPVPAGAWLCRAET